MNTFAWKTLSYIAATALLSVFAPMAAAANIPGLFNTGVLANKAVAAAGSVDLHYVLVSSADVNFPGPSAFIANPIAVGSWLANSSTSQWIAPAANQAFPGAANHPGGNYVYRLSFDLTGFDPATASISGSWAADDSGADILLNGVTTGNTASGYGALTPFVLGSGFVSGMNTLEFVVTNNVSPGSNPTGLRVDALMGTADIASHTMYTGGTLTDVTFHSPFGGSAHVATLTGTDLNNWLYDDIADTLTASGAFQDLFSNVSGSIFTHAINGLVLNTSGGAAAATTFNCIEGVFGGFIFASICGGYLFGDNGVNDSTASWGPGVAYSRTIGGDDVVAAPPQNSILFYDGFQVDSFSGGTLIVSNAWFTFTVNGLLPAPDADGDGFVNAVDNCTMVANSTQCDTDSDGFGNRCDGDLNNNSVTNAQDYAIFRSRLGTVNADADLNCNGGNVNAQDYAIFRSLLGAPPGPGVGP